MMCQIGLFLAKLIISLCVICCLFLELYLQHDETNAYEVLLYLVVTMSCLFALIEMILN